MRECPVPKRWTSPSAAMASAQIWLARSIAAVWVASMRSKMARAAENQVTIALANDFGVDGDRFPVTALHRDVGGIDDTVHHIAVDEGLSWHRLLRKALYEMTHLFLIPVHPGLVRYREHPAGLGVGLLHQIAGALLDEGAHAGRAGIGDDAALGAVDFIAQLHSAPCGPGSLGQRGAAIFEAQQQDRVVLAGCLLLVHERGAPGEDVLDRMLLAEQVASGLDRVAAHVQQGAPAGDLSVPEMGRVRPRVGLAGTDRQEISDGSGLDPGARLHDVPREDLGLGVAVDHARRPGQPNHLGGLRRVARQRLGAHERLLRRGRDPGRVDVQVIGQPDHDQLHLRIGTQGIHRRVVTRDPMASPKLLGALLGTGVIRHNLRARDVTQAVHVEVRDETGAEQADLTPPPAPSLPRSGGRVGGGAAAAFRARKSSSMAAVAVAPTRVTPSSRTCNRASRVRTPPASFTWTRGETVRRISARSSSVAPVGAKPVEVLTKSAPAASASWQPRTFCASSR